MPVRNALFALLALALPALPQKFDVKTQTLSNGMKVLVQEDRDIPNVAMYLFYKIGSRNERPGITGISHYFEHMMFNGAKKYGPKQFDIVMEKNGGNNNAYTTRDLTVYTNWFPRTMLELMFDMEADRIRDLAFDPKIVESERGVVYSERRSNIDNNPFGILFEQLYANAYLAHPYSWPVVGWSSDIEAWSMDDLKGWFKMGYAPNNCVLVIVGDVTSEEVFGLAKKYLEPIPRQDPPPAVRTKEPEQIGERRVTIRRPAQLPIQFIGYHAAASNDPDYLPLQVMLNILQSGRSSRLYSRLVEKEQLALNVGGGVNASLDPGLILFNMQPRAGVDTAATEKALFGELDRMRNSEVTPAELSKAKNQILSQLFQQTKTIAGRANLLGTYEIYFGGHQELANAEARLDKVTAADIKRVAEKYLNPNRRTVATLIPEKR
ncbi:MAG: pitrilysin family protein [Bryobacteraceae bacterium]|nr:pitrilysin family protein [Bryobacteraceae bacterium]